MMLIGPIAALLLTAVPSTEATPPQSPFQERGYYITFMRVPTYNMAAWKHIVDGIHDDGGNLLLLWKGVPLRPPDFG